MIFRIYQISAIFGAVVGSIIGLVGDSSAGDVHSWRIAFGFVGIGGCCTGLFSFYFYPPTSNSIHWVTFH